MAQLNAGFPNAPFTGPNGDIAPVWRAWLLAIYARTGSAQGISSASLLASIATEVAARAAADTALSNALADEATTLTAAIAAEAAIRAAADAALAASVQTFTWSQNVAASVWTINHTLNRHPSIEVVDSSGRIVEGDIAYVSSNQMTVSFAAAFSGVAYLN